MSLIHRSMQLVASAALAALGVLVAPGASANCTVNPLVGFSAQNIDINLGEVSVPPSVPVGGVFLTRVYNISPKPSNSFICGPFGPNGGELVVFQPISNGYVPEMGW